MAKERSSLGSFLHAEVGESLAHQDGEPKMLPNVELKNCIGRFLKRKMTRAFSFTKNPLAFLLPTLLVAVRRLCISIALRLCSSSACAAAAAAAAATPVAACGQLFTRILPFVARGRTAAVVRPKGANETILHITPFHSDEFRYYVCTLRVRTLRVSHPCLCNRISRPLRM